MKKEGQYIRLNLFATTLCDTGCAHCLSNSGTKNPTHFSIEMAQQIVDECKRYKLRPTVLFTGGGEPLLNPNLLEIVDVFGEYPNTNMINLITSGFRSADDEFRKSQWMALLKRSYSGIDMIHFHQSFSLYQSSFPERLKNAIKLMLESDGGYLRVRACMSLENCIETWEAVEKSIANICNELGAEQCFRLPLGYDGEDERTFMPAFENIMHWQDQHFLIKFQSIFIPVWYFIEADGIGFLICVTPISFEAIGRGKNIRQSPYASFLCESFSAQDGRVDLCVLPDGNVYPGSGCSGVLHMRLGKIGEDSLAEMIKRKEVFSRNLWMTFLASRKNVNWLTPDSCRMCQQLVAEKGLELK